MDQVQYSGWANGWATCRIDCFQDLRSYQVVVEADSDAEEGIGRTKTAESTNWDSKAEQWPAEMLLARGPVVAGKHQVLLGRAIAI